ncbi:MAG: histidinol-phosphate transaminase [Peptostreptococcaceae bacterium]
MINHGANLYDIENKYGYKKNEMIDFSSNINPLGSSTLAKEALIKNIDLISIYPDSSYSNLKSSISNYCSSNNENIILGSGATELISSYINAINPKNALLLSPVYSEYERELNKLNCSIKKIYATKEDNFKIDTNNLIDEINSNTYDLVIICNPNNPTGFIFNKLEIKKILENTNSKIMIDETYIEFTDIKTFSSSFLVNNFKNLFVIRGTSKFFSTPGIRLGYALLSDEIIKYKISQKIDLWNINILASIMGEIMFLDNEYIKNTFNFIQEEKEFLFNSLSKINDITPYESYGNFILCEITSKILNGNNLRETLLKEKIIIRDCKSFEGLDEYFFRVCVLNKENNRLLIDNLNNIFNKNKA